MIINPMTMHDDIHVFQYLNLGRSGNNYYMTSININHWTLDMQIRIIIHRYDPPLRRASNP